MDEQTYFLSKTTLRLSLDKYQLENQIEHRITTRYEGTALLIDRADLLSPRKVRVPERHIADTSSTLVFRDDRRLNSLDASSTGQGPTFVKAGIGVIGTVVGLVVSVTNPLAGLSIAAAGAGAAKGIRFERLTAAPTRLDVGVADDEESPALEAYGEAFKDAKKLLLELTTALRLVSREIGAMAQSATTAELDDLTKRRGLLGSQLDPVQAHFAAWVAAKSTKTLVDRREVDFEIAALPTTEQLKEATAIDQWWKRPERDWIRWARDAGVAVTIDFEDDDAPDRDQVADTHSEVRLEYRVGRPATVTTWSISREHIPERRDDGGNTVAEAVATTLVPQSRIHRRLVGADNPVRFFTLDQALFKSGKLSVKFNDIGEVSELGGDGSRLVAKTVSDVPSSLETAFESGGKISAALVPGTTSAARLSQALEVAKNRKELDPLLHPNPPDADAKAKAELEAQVAMAELEARLALAHYASSRPGSQVIVHDLSS